MRLLVPPTTPQREIATNIPDVLAVAAKFSLLYVIRLRIFSFQPSGY